MREGQPNTECVSVSYSVKYLTDGKTENWSDFENSLKWILSYTKRNRIENEMWDEPVDQFVYGETERSLRLVFKSYHQFKIFVRQGNILFPYMEFI